MKQKPQSEPMKMIVANPLAPKFSDLTPEERHQALQNAKANSKALCSPKSPQPNAPAEPAKADPNRLDFSKENLVGLQQERNLEGDDEMVIGKATPLPSGAKSPFTHSAASEIATERRGGVVPTAHELPGAKK